MTIDTKCPKCGESFECNGSGIPKSEESDTNKKIRFNNIIRTLPDGYTKAKLVDIDEGGFIDCILNSDNHECRIAIIDRDFYILDPDYPCKRILLEK